MRNSRLFLAALALLSLPGLRLAAQTPLPAGIERVTTVEGITEYKVKSNGLRILLFPDPTKNTATVNITYIVGSRHENYGETGMAHLLEHLVFKGTPKHPAIPKEINDHGCTFNGTTSWDRTNYYESCNATEANLRWALDLEADRMVNSFIARKDLDSEMTVVRNEYESGENNPIGSLFKRVLSTMFEWHNYGKTTIGNRSDIENVNIERLQAFYRRYYQPDNAVLTIAGKIDEPRTLALVNEYFGSIPKPTRILEPTYTEEPVQDGERSATVRRVGGIQAFLLGYHIPAGHHPDFASLSLLAEILGDDTNGRLYKRLVETKKVTQVFAQSLKLAEPGFFYGGAVLAKKDNLPEARDLAINIIEGFAKEPVTKTELDQARQGILKSFDLNANNSERLGLTLSEFIASGDWRLYFLNRDRIKTATLEDVQRVAVTYFKSSNRTVGTFIPEDKPDRTEIPKAPEVSSLVKDYKGGAAVAAGEAFDSTPSNIDKLTQRGTLSSGLKTLLLPKKTRGEKVTVQLTLRFGDEKSLVGKREIASLAASLLERGTTKHTKAQIKEDFDRYKANVRISGSASQAVASIETTRPNLSPVLALVAEIFTSPTFLQSEFDELVKARITSIEDDLKEPQSIAMNAISRHMAPYPKTDVRYRPTPEEQLETLKSVKLEEVKAFYKQFYGASNGEISIVGDFDLPAIRTQLDSSFGKWKSPAPYTLISTKYKPVPAVNLSFQTPDKANAMFLAGFPVQIADDNPDYPALLIGNYILGGGMLNSRLADRIRGKEGLSYGVGSQFGVTPLEDNASFMGYAILNPANVNKVEKAFREELARAFAEGFTAAEVEAAKKGYLQSRQVQRGEDRNLASILGTYTSFNRTLAFMRDLESKIDTLTLEQVNAAFKKYMNPASLSVFKAGDFEKAGVKP